MFKSNVSILKAFKEKKTGILKRKIEGTPFLDFLVSNVAYIVRRGDESGRPK